MTAPTSVAPTAAHCNSVGSSPLTTPHSTASTGYPAVIGPTSETGPRLKALNSPPTPNP